MKNFTFLIFAENYAHDPQQYVSGEYEASAEGKHWREALGNLEEKTDSRFSRYVVGIGIEGGAIHKVKAIHLF